MIKSLLLDFDGVVAESFDFHYRAWQKVITDFDARPYDMVIKLHEGQPARMMVQAIYQAAGLPLDSDKAQQLAKEKNLAFRRLGQIPVYPQVFTLLQMAKEQGLKRALVTGTRFENVRYVIGEERLQLFDAIIQDGDYQHPKPHPEPYLMAAERLSIAPQHSLVVENAPLGIAAAKKAGMFCVALMTTLPKEHLHGADVILKDHEELLQKFTLLIEQKLAS